MKQLLEALKSARRIEILIIVVMLCVLLVLGAGSLKQETNANDTEARMAGILSEINGAGRVCVMLAENAGEPTGCVIAAEGADDVRVLLELQRAARALTGLELDRIEIVQAKR